MNNINICMITDNNFVLPTAVTIESIVQNSNPNYHYNIFIICNKNVDSQNQDKLVSCAKVQENISIKLVIVADDSRYQSFVKKDFPVSIAATFKFAIPDLLPHLSKVLYIDGDLIVQSDLVDLYFTNISSVYAGVIKDYHALTFKGDVWTRLGIKLDGYFNSGVMLLNLVAMRNDNITESLIDYRLHGINYYMDQDALNVVFGKKVTYLDFKYNATVTNWRNKTSQDLSNYYGMEYREDKYDYLREAEIIHYCSSDKPWKYYDTHMADLWYKYFLSSVFCQIDLGRQSLNSIISDPQVKNIRIQKGDVFAQNAMYHLSTLSGNPIISVILPAYNAQNYIAESISWVLQSTFPSFELICVNDGSTDNTLDIIQEFAKKDDRIILINQENSYAGVARNNAIAIARGEYITFLDADDLFSICALERMYTAAVANSADMVVSAACEFENELENLRPMNYWLKEEFLPRTNKVSSSEMIPYLFNFTTGGPAGKMVSKKLITKWNLHFLDLRKSEDFFFVQRALYKTQFIAIVREPIYYRRNLASSLEHSKEKHPTIFYDAVVKFKEIMIQDNCYYVYQQTFINENIARFTYNLRTLRNDIEAYSIVLGLFESIAEQELGLGYFPARYYYNKDHYNYLMSLKFKDRYEIANSEISQVEISLNQQERPFFTAIRKFSYYIREYGVTYTLKLTTKKLCYAFLHKVHSGIHCCLDHGFKYTIKHTLKKILRKN